MTTDQENAFKQGTGGLFDVAQTEYLFYGALAVTLLVWVAWISIKAYQGFAGGELEGEEAGLVVVRAVILMTVLLFMVSWA